jgi:hypothetical protein
MAIFAIFVRYASALVTLTPISKSPGTPYILLTSPHKMIYLLFYEKAGCAVSKGTAGKGMTIV